MTTQSQTEKTREPKMLTARELANKARVSPEVLRKIFCREFDWAREA